MSTAKSTTTVTSDTGAIIPASCDQRTPLELLPACVQAYHEVTGGTVALDTLTQVIDAMRDASAVVVLYCDGKGEVAARVLWPAAVGLTKDKNMATRSYDTRHRAYRTFRLDRIIACHGLTTPDDVEPQERSAQKADPAKIAIRLGQTLVTFSHAAHLDAADAALLADAVDDAQRIYKAVVAA